MAKWISRVLAWAYRRRYVAVHHAVLATTIAAVMLAAEKNNTVKSVDVITRGLLAMAHVAATVPDAANKSAGERPPIVVVPYILGQSGAHGCAPGEFLSELIRAAADFRPKVLVLDLELGIAGAGPRPQTDVPFAGGPAAEQPCTPATTSATPPAEDPETYSDTLLAAVRYASAARHVHVIVRAPPLPMSAEAFHEAALQGPNGRPDKDPVHIARAMGLLRMREMCAMPGVSFGSGIDQFAVMFYAPSSPYLGNVAARVAADGNENVGAPDECSIFRPYFNKSDRVITSAAVFDKWGDAREVGDAEKISSVDLHYYDTSSQYHALEWRPNTALASHLTAKALGADYSGKALFIGDANGVREALTGGPTYDTDVEAAMFYSDLHRVFTLPPILDFFLEVLLGTALGFLFYWSWGIVARAANEMEAISVRERGRKARAFLLARFHLVWNLLLLAGVIAGSFYLLDQMFSRGAWLNPLPVILGMALKGLLNSRRHRHGHAPQSFTELIDMHPDVVWEIPVIAVGLGIAML